MITQLILKLRILPRWVIILIDLGMMAFSTLLGYLLRFNFEWSIIENYSPWIGIGVNIACLLVAVTITKSYAGIVRYTGLRDGVRMFYTLSLSVLMAVAVNVVYFYFYAENLIPYSVIFISFMAGFLFLYQYRLVIKNIFSYNHKRKVVIFGAGQLGIITQQVIEGTADSNLKVVAFVEDDIRKVGKLINGTQIYHAQADIDLLIESFEVSELIIAIDQLSLERKNDIVDTCLRHDIKVRTVPKVEEWVEGEFSIKQIKEILIDQAESPLYEIEMEITPRVGDMDFYCFVADVRNEVRLEEILATHRPDIIYHAAAYKHVPMMERNPLEAVHCNIIGTMNLARLAVKYQVHKFVMISTDKAVNPTNVMGCSKRISEIFVQSLNNYLIDKKKGNTAFVTTRFGNVLGSNGSVIPFFKKQIAKGGPVTVTHPDITRYFMTIPEACQLVLEAGAMGNGGEIFIFDMGKSIKIVDLAKKMIRLSGLELNKDIEIVFTGLREGEKLFEELLANEENTIPTHHSKIMIAKTSVYEYDNLVKRLERLTTEALKSRDRYAIVRIMKEIVPEFKSNSSEYQVLDKQITFLN